MSRSRKSPARASFQPQVECLEERAVPAVVAVADPGAAFTGDIVGARFKSFANTGSREIYLGTNNLGVGANRSEVDYSWRKPGEYAVMFTNDPAVTGDADGSTLLASVTPTNGTGGAAKTLKRDVGTLPANLNAFEIVFADRHVGEVELTNVVVDGDALPGFTGNLGGPDVNTSTKYFSDQLADGKFTITGTILLNGPFSGGDERSKVEFKIGRITPAAVETYGINTGFAPYQLAQNAQSNSVLTQLTDNSVGGWQLDEASSASHWLTVRRTDVPNEPYNELIVNPGTYVFQTTINLQGGTNGSAADASINGLQFAADNRLLEIRINGVTAWAAADAANPAFGEDFYGFHSLGTLGNGLFQLGDNTIDFVVANQLGTSPVGLRVEGLVVDL